MEIEKEIEIEMPKKVFEDKQPTLSKSITLSKDQKWLIIKTIRTDIVHINYLHKVITQGD